MMADDYTRGKIVGWIFWIIGIGVLIMGGISLLAYLAMPVAEIAGDALGSLDSNFGFGRGGKIHSLAALCVVIIGVIGLVKVLTRRK